MCLNAANLGPPMVAALTFLGRAGAYLDTQSRQFGFGGIGRLFKRGNFRSRSNHDKAQLVAQLPQHFSQCGITVQDQLGIQAATQGTGITLILYLVVRRAAHIH